jgi:hypothetical protein
MVIVFQHEVPVRVVNISRSGCLLQVPRLVRAGTVGRLRLALDGGEYADDVRIARCAPLADVGYGLGVELLWVPRSRESRNGQPSLVWRLRASSDDGPTTRSPTDS